jgi:hypothetical protein
LPAVGREQSWALLTAALDAIAARGVADQVMINHVVEIASMTEIKFFELPAP